MARKETTIDIQDRDQLLTFKIREMPATRLESWIARAFMLVPGAVAPDQGNSVTGGVNIGAAGAFLAANALSILGGMDYDKVQPLLDEMLGCCSRVIGGMSGRVEERCTPESVDGYIQDVMTLVTLRMEALKLNLGFLRPEAVATLSGSPASDNTLMQ